VKKISLSIAAAVIAMTTAGAVVAGELPTYEKAGYPVSAVQVQVLGADSVQQVTPAATSVSPVQLSVLTPRGQVKTAQGRSETVGRAIQ